jgi:hypothetical protein
MFLHVAAPAKTGEKANEKLDFREEKKMAERGGFELPEKWQNPSESAI